MVLASLTKDQRDALPNSKFAVPGKRQLPIHDERHTRMAWSQLPRTQGLTDSERAAAKTHILRRARELGIDTSDWELHSVAFQVEAMSLALPDVPDHPNRLPFTGILTRVDEPSDQPPGGAGGKRVMIPKDVAELALPTLLGMGIDYTEDFDGHNAKAKIGIITEATITGNAIHIAGFLYAKDFPEECARIQAEKKLLGFSYECNVAVVDMNADPWVVTDIVFTGAAVLYKEKAAYQSTSLAAQAQPEYSDMELKDVMDAVTKLTASVTAIAAAVDAHGKKLEKVEAAGASLAGPIIDQVMPHVGACNAAADNMEKAGIGSHQSAGHASAIRRVAAHMLQCAVAGRLPHIYNDHGYVESGADKAVEAAAAAAKKAADEAQAATQTQLKAVTEGLAAITTKLTDLEAKGFKNSQAPERKTVSAEVVSILTKVGLKPEDAGKITVTQVDTALEAAGVKGAAAIAAKLKMRQDGVLAA